jgi:hypothetical protein
MKSLIVLILLNAVLFYSFWGHWDILFILSVALYYAYKKFLIDYADRMLK